jgi:diguanylate cyclase (GGDEF)-like protein
VLRAIGARLQATVRLDETVARFGGEEFSLVLAGAVGKRAAEASERFRAAVAEVSVGDAPVTVSAGVASWPAHAQGRDELLEAADQALYRAKRRGKNRTEHAGEGQ